MVDFLAAHALRMPARAAVVLGTEQLTFGDLERQSNALANALLDLGIEPADHATTIGYNSLEHFIVSAASRKLVLVGMPMNYRLRPDEVLYQLAHSETRVVFCGPEHVAVVDQVASQCPQLEFKVTWRGSARTEAALPEGWYGLNDLLETASSEPPPVESGLTAPSMSYTAGTTGNPKGAYRAEGTDPGVIARYSEWFGLKPLDVHLVAGPLYHSAPGAFAAFTHIFGGTNVVLPRFDAEAALRAIDRHRVTTSFMAPILLKRITELPQATKDKYDVSSLRAVIVAAAPCPHELKKRIVADLGEVLFEFYGSSELGLNTLLRPEEQLTHPGSCGRPVEGVEIKALDDDSNEVATGEPGELWIRSPQAINEYWQNEEATEEARRNGMWSVGDVGYFDRDGYLYIVDRKRDMIISGGVNICTTEVENVLHAHPDVRDVVVIGIPSEEWGEQVHAVVESHAAGDSACEDELRRLAAEQLADFKRPRSFEFRDRLPRDEAGKIRKREIREHFWQGQERSV